MPHVCNTGFHVRAMLVQRVYAKILRLAPASRARFSSGQIFNLVTTDTEQVQTLSQFALGVISSPLRIVVALYLLYGLLGPSSITALVVLVVSMPLQVLFVKQSAVLLRKALMHTDERVGTYGTAWSILWLLYPVYPVVPLTCYIQLVFTFKW